MAHAATRSSPFCFTCSPDGIARDLFKKPAFSTADSSASPTLVPFHVHTFLSASLRLRLGRIEAKLQVAIIMCNNSISALKNSAETMEPPFGWVHLFFCQEVQDKQNQRASASAAVVSEQTLQRFPTCGAFPPQFSQRRHTRMILYNVVKEQFIFQKCLTFSFKAD